MVITLLNWFYLLSARHDHLSTRISCRIVSGGLIESGSSLRAVATQFATYTHAWATRNLHHSLPQWKSVRGLGEMVAHCMSRVELHSPYYTIGSERNGGEPIDNKSAPPPRTAVVLLPASSELCICVWLMERRRNERKTTPPASSMELKLPNTQPPRYNCTRLSRGCYHLTILIQCVCCVFALFFLFFAVSFQRVRVYPISREHSSAHRSIASQQWCQTHTHTLNWRLLLR